MQPMKILEHNHEDFRLTQLMGIVTRHMKLAINKNIARENIQLEFQHWIILKYLDSNTGTPQCEIAKHGKKNKTSITRMINTMEKMDLVVRKSNKLDKRNRLIFLTPKGHALSESVTPIVFRTIDAIEKGIDSREVIIAENVLFKMFENIKLLMSEPLENSQNQEEQHV